LTGENTAGGSGEHWRGVYIGATTTTFSSHLYTRDAQGAHNTDLEFGYTVGVKFPTSAGIYTGYSPNVGTIQAALDDAAANDDTDYAEATSQSASFSVGMGTVAATPIIHAVETVAMVKNTADAPGLTFTPRVVLTADTTPINIDGSWRSAVDSAYRAFRERFGAGLHPLTGLPWTVAQLNAAEFGGYATP
jgi:hypothetical protein